jgi:phosphatidylserine decarboxylase
MHIERKILRQYLAPQRLMAFIASFFANHRWVPLKNFLIRDFLSRFTVNLSEATEEDPYAYSCFNDFFTRTLKPTARPLPDNTNHCLLSPADGLLSAYGPIKKGTLLQAKGHYFDASELIGDPSSHTFDAGSFCTIYLAPPDYHRVHMPTTGTLTGMRYIPGRLFSVNLLTAEEIPRLFARNERVVAFFDTPNGKMALVFVGAMIVGSIHTTWHGEVNPHHSKDQPIHHWDYVDHPRTLEAGEECGHFCLGSTVIVLTEKPCSFNDSLSAKQPVQIRKILASFTS